MCFFPPLHLKHWTGVLISQHISVPSKKYKPIHIFLILSMSKIEQLNHTWYLLWMYGASYSSFEKVLLVLFVFVCLWGIYLKKKLKKLPKCGGIILVRHLSLKSNEPYHSGNQSRFISIKKRKDKLRKIRSERNIRMIKGVIWLGQFRLQY